MAYDVRHMSGVEQRSGYAGESPKERLAATMRVLEEGVDAVIGSEQFAHYLSCMSKFWNYSFSNVCLIHTQRPEATRVAGYRRWLELGRQVKRGERGIKILVPHKMRVREDEAGDEQNQSVVTSFGVGTVFDVAQTEGQELPEPPLVRELRESSDAGSLLRSLLGTYLRSEGVSLEEGPTLPANGFYDPGTVRIVVGEHLVGNQRAKTLAHETAHFVAGHRLGMSGPDVETVAESSAFVVLQHFGIDSGEYSFPYVARWASDKQVLKRNLDAIQRTANQIIECLERPELSSASHSSVDMVDHY